MKQKKLSKNYSAPALDKGLNILELLSTSENGLTQGQIASKLNKSVNEIYRMISTLRSREYVELDEETDIYNLSYKNILLYEGGFPEWKEEGFPIKINTLNHTKNE